MAKYIDADRLIRRLENRTYRAKGKFIEMINEQEAADVVSRGVLEQVMWERDLAISQLEEIGKGFGEKMDDVVKVRHGRWIENETSYADHPTKQTCNCSICGRASTRPLGDWCRWCGAKMDEVTDGE